MSDYRATPNHPRIGIEDRTHPDRPDRGRTPPTVRGARRYDCVRSIYGLKSREHDAAERYRDDCAIASGAQVGPQAILRGGGYPGSGGPSDAVLDALGRV